MKLFCITLIQTLVNKNVLTNEARHCSIAEYAAVKQSMPLMIDNRCFSRKSRYFSRGREKINKYVYNILADIKGYGMFKG